jgi:hypothetical protein
MLVFPQLSTGASVQYPLTKQFSQRSVQSAMEDGTIITLADSPANYLRWRIPFQDLSNQEIGLLTSFFVATQGELSPFLFLDPTANLLFWSEDFSQAAWVTAGLTFDTAVADPLGTSRAVRAHNSTATDLTISQLTQIPGACQVCFSVYLRADTPTAATLTRTAVSNTQTLSLAVTDNWQRFYLAGVFPSSSDPSQFAITVPAGTALESFGPQLDAQVTPSTYIISSGQHNNVYANARFDMKQIDATSTGPNRNACVVYVRCNLPGGE